MNAHSQSPQRWHPIVKDGELKIYRDGCNRMVVLNRPRNGNALTTAMVTRLTNFFLESARDTTISRIVVTAEGRFFCTGMDLGKSTTAVNQGKDVSSKEFRMFVDLFEAIQNSPQVTIAVISGPCYAGGIGLAFSCDIRLAVATASVTLSEVKLGLCPAIISQYLVREWGTAFTREAMLSGRTISMSELKAIGAVHGIATDAASLQYLTASYLTNLRSCAPKASAMCKGAVRTAYTTSDQKDKNLVIKEIFMSMMEDGSESSIGIKNFQTKRRRLDWDSYYGSKPQSKL
ncbi:hypothetical protein NW762_010689 [Fusarium torreyae]|uniref:Enoyl-CoA hydratase n=1 Tax=Fusarium torreyae TaxID=1237075 RepID=A0A9W8VD43_9HYPO|nr:hypothetical protein NW762_010689 [Fusarium torreyae]